MSWKLLGYTRREEVNVMKKDLRGFTLLELLMVVIIIAILAAIALPQYLRASEKSRASEALQVLGALRASEQRYKAQSATQVYTKILADLDMDYGANLTNWANPAFAVTAGPPATGMITTTRKAGTYSGQTVGIQLGTGTICGDFAPMGTLAACAQD